MNVLLLLMGGSGSRFGGPTPKQFLELEHEGVLRPLFEVTARRLLSALPIDIAIFVSPKNTAGSAVLNPVLEKLAADFPGRQFRYAAAGVTRFGSFMSGVNALRKFQGIERLLVHDANRPYLAADFLQRVGKHLAMISPSYPACIPVMPVVDSIVRVDGANVVTYENRAELNRVQTPQLLHFNTFQEAETRALARGQLAMDFTDEGSLCLSLGLPVQTFAGDAANVKITYPEDLK